MTVGGGDRLWQEALMITTADASAKSSAASVTRLAAGTLHMRWSIVIAQTVPAQSKQPYAFAPALRHVTGRIFLRGIGPYNGGLLDR